MRTLLFVCVALIAAGTSRAEKPPRVVPASADTVLERLPRGYADVMPRAGATRPPLAAAQALLATAARTGDGRLATRADALLAALPASKQATPGVRKARAFAAQHRHDFAAALSLLDATLSADPRDADARLARAQIQLVQGRLADARRDCAALALGVDADAGLLCIAALELRRGRTGSAAALLDRWLARSIDDRAMLRHVLVMRGETASRSHDADANRWFAQAIALAPDDVRTLAALARHLRANGRPREAWATLATAPDTDGLALQRALAAREARLPQAARLADAQAARFARAHAVGAETELRDEAEFALVVRGDAMTALAIARRNFATQKDAEDVDLLLRAANAAGRTDVVASVEAWLRGQDIAQTAVSHD